MRKIIFSINTTIDGFADHTAGIADAELHDFFADFLVDIDVVLLGRKTYEMMADYWPHAAEDPRSTKSEIRFADKYNAVPKIVFSKTLKEVNWNNTRLSKGNMIEEVLKLRQSPSGGSKNIAAGSLSIASALAEKNLIDEYWFLFHPVILGKGKQLLEGLNNKINLKLIETKNFGSGVIAAHYEKT